MAPSLPAHGQMGKCENRRQGQVPVTPRDSRRAQGGGRSTNCPSSTLPT